MVEDGGSQREAGSGASPADGLRPGLRRTGDRVVSTEELLGRGWDEAADPFTTVVKTTVRRLRARLGDPPVIHTVREGGYRIGAA